MAKRVGKSGSRRGRKARRPASRAVPLAPSTAASAAVPPSLPLPSPTATTVTTPPAAPRPAASNFAGPSRLGERAAADYHYVARDLRNIGILVVVMAALLAVATIAFNVLGIGPG